VLGRGLTIRGSVRGEDGSPLAGYFVMAAEQGHSTEYRRQARTDAAGLFELTNAKEFTHSVEVFAPDVSGTFPSLWTLARQLDVRPGPAELALVVREADRPSARLRGILVGPDGGPVAGATVSVMHASGHGATTDRTGTEGRFESGLLPPGRVDVLVQAPEFGSVAFGERRLSRGKDLDVGRLVLQKPGSLTVEVVDAGGAAPEHVLCMAQSETTTARTTGRNGSARFERLQPGTYAVWSELRDAVAVAVDVVVIEAGREAVLRATPRPGARQDFAVRLPAGDVGAGWVRMTVRREDDPTVHQVLTLRRTSESPLRGTLTLPPGRYRADAETDTGLVAAGRFDTTDFPPGGSALELSLR
jgi:hypothetical protein